MKTYGEVINIADQQILTVSEYSEARYLMRELCENNNIDLYTNLDNFVDEDINKTFQEGVRRLINEEPVAHILGYSWFYGRKFTVNDDVLIPRAETEQLVLNTILEVEEFFDTFDLKLLDLACGSGAIGISLKLEESDLDVSISDISADALKVAKLNADQLNASVNVYESDMLDVMITSNQKYDVIVCNPPYILNDESLQNSVKDFEPHLALFGGVDGLDFYRQVLNESKQVLNSPGILAFEMGYDQKETLSHEILKVYPNAKLKHFKDYANLDRMIFIFI